MKKNIMEFARDKNIQTMLVASAVISIASYAVWMYVIERGEYFIYTVIGYFPLQFLGVVLLLHLILGAYAYNKEKNLAYLALGSLLFFSFFVLVLELMYIINHG